MIQTFRSVLDLERLANALLKDNKVDADEASFLLEAALFDKPALTLAEVYDKDPETYGVFRELGLASRQLPPEVSIGEIYERLFGRPLPKNN